MLSKNQVVKVRKAIEQTYDGRCTVTEHQEYVRDNGSTGFRDVITLNDHPCRLSFSNISATEPGEASATTKQMIKLFINPDVVIRAGSKLSVTQAGVTTDYTCSGIPAKYDTHQEIMLELFQRWS